MLALARPSVNEVWPLAVNQNHRFNRPANDNNITSGLCTRTKFAYVAPGTSCAPPSTLTNCGALQLASETNNGYYNQHTAYYYDAGGRMSQRWAAETQETFGYDTLGRINSYGTPLGTFTLGYLNNTGQLASRSVTNGSITLSQSYGYDTNTNDRRLLTITASSNALRSYTLGYVNGGGVDRYNIRSVTESTANHPIGAQTWAHNYDGGDRLISSVGTLVSNSGATSNAGTYGWELDKLDNPTKATYPDYGGYDDYPTYLNTATPPADNNLNQMNKNAWWQGYTYDANGNTTAEVDLNNSSAPLRTYKWDMEGRLLQMTDPNASGGHTVRFHYDGMGRRILQKTTTNGTTTYKRYQWCGDRICQQRTTSTARVRSYLLTGEYDFTASKKYVYFADHLGSVRDLADADTGARVGALDYTPYGSERASDGTLPDFRYAGLMWTSDMGLYMSSTRAYDPGAMRWLNRDWIREAGGINMYAYVGGNPLSYTDPEGLDKSGGAFTRWCQIIGLCAVTIAPPEGKPIHGPVGQPPAVESTLPRPGQNYPSVEHNPEQAPEKLNPKPDKPDLPGKEPAVKEPPPNSFLGACLALIRKLKLPHIIGQCPDGRFPDKNGVCALETSVP